MAKCYFYNEDCLASMKRMQEKGFKVDLVLSSPPYNTGRPSNSKRSIENLESRYDIHLDDMTDEEYAKWITKIFNNFDKILNENGVILWNVSYGNEKPNSMWFSLLSLLQNTDFMIAEMITWKKKSALPNNVSHNKLTRIIEPVFVICRKNEYKTYNANKQVKSTSSTGQKYYENIYNFIEAANNDGSCHLNKATYSSDLCNQLLTIYAKKDAIVYDPFMGTGTTAIACEGYGNENMMCIGSELSEAQVEYSKNRLKEFRLYGLKKNIRMEKEYTWYPENSDRFYNTYNSVEECIEVAKREYNTKTGDFYGCDGRYSPIINIGIVEHIDYDKLVNICYDGIQDNVHDYIDEFAFGTDFETECYFNENEENDIKLKLKEIIHSLFINPIKRASIFKMKYDLNKNGWIDE